MTELFWKLIAKVVSHPRIRAKLIIRANRTPYSHLTSADGTEAYMRRWWLFNPYDYETRETKYPWCPISIRIHHILTPDRDRDMHDHPWNARTIILKGGYLERRPSERDMELLESVGYWDPEGVCSYRNEGDTVALNHDQYHQIIKVSRGGVFTMFITGKYRGMWGYIVNGVKVPWRKYLGLE